MAPRCGNFACASSEKFRKVFQNNKNSEKFRKIQKKSGMRPAGSGEMQKSVEMRWPVPANFRIISEMRRPVPAKFIQIQKCVGRFRQKSEKFIRPVPACSKLTGICNKFTCAPCRWDCAKRTSCLALIPSAFFAPGHRCRNGKISMPHS